MTHEEYLAMCDERERLEKQIAEYEKHCTYGCIRVFANKMGRERTKDGYSIQFDAWMQINKKFGRHKPKWKTIYNSTEREDVIAVMVEIMHDLPKAYEAFLKHEKLITKEGE